MGNHLKLLRKKYIKLVDSLVPIWYSNSGYVHMLWACLWNYVDIENRSL
ncbi:hypothetical protein HGP05_08420 [Streptococcus sanguinis]|uniref:Uncharacterized protein n=1 Tax=Streptococcus sanguinis TaxID=1305 RepID=A0A7Y0YRZ8_STRSA|nr:hypothetical protein [Streptococcus sanguinis]